MCKFSSRLKTILDGIVTHQRISHTYLFSGCDSAHIDLAAEYFAKALNCNDFKSEPCGNCASCQMMHSENKVDTFSLLQNQSIKIESIRQLQEACKYGPSQSRYFIGLIYGADTLTLQAANALLKTLEEPPQNVIFILLTHNAMDILPTIRSRSQLLEFPSEGALAPLDSLISYPDFCQKSLTERFQWVGEFAKDKAQVKVTLYAWVQALWQMQETLSSNDFENLDLITEAAFQLRHNVNMRLHLENLSLRIR